MPIDDVYTTCICTCMCMCMCMCMLHVYTCMCNLMFIFMYRNALQATGETSLTGHRVQISDCTPDRQQGACGPTRIWAKPFIGKHAGVQG